MNFSRFGIYQGYRPYQPSQTIRVNILHTTLSFEPGGRRQAIENLADGGNGTGFNSYLCCLNQTGCPREKIAARFEDHLELNRRSLFGRRERGVFRSFVRDNNIDLIHSHDGAALFFSSLFLLGDHRVKQITTFHRSLGIETATFKGKVRNALALLRCNLVLTASEERRNHYIQENWVSPRKVRTIPLGIDLSQFAYSAAGRNTIRIELGIPDSALVFGAIGHFGGEKGIDIVIRAFLRYSRQEPGAHLLVVGTGSDSQIDLIRSLVPAEGEDHSKTKVHFLGFRSDIGDVLSACDVFVHGARQEAFGLVLAEALSNGKPVVATATGGAAQILNPDVGVIVPVDDVESMADTLSDIASQPEIRAQMGASAVERAQKEFSVQSYAKVMTAVYSEVLEN
ncbi:MAG: glycosyltransferase family 4 protein [Pseudomonadota bacterium]